MSLLIGDNMVVSMHYKLTDDEGKVLDSSEGSTPLCYLHGAGNIVPGLEKMLVDKGEGDSLQVRVEPSEGYGEFIPELIEVVDIATFQGIEPLEAGMGFEIQEQDGSKKTIVIKQVDGDVITVDANHPLAGVVLNFDVDIVGVREATEAEIAHSHPFLDYLH
ncbi:MAG: peptidylprolyl isomerase [Pseudomonadota bacterium]